jgi:hypothetical protein
MLNFYNTDAARSEAAKETIAAHLKLCQDVLENPTNHPESLVQLAQRVIASQKKDS